MRIELLTG
jgi:hypothetical protein